MGRSLDDVLATILRERRAKIPTRAAAIMAEEMSLRDLRKARLDSSKLLHND